jgi:hypothetical protein
MSYIGNMGIWPDLTPTAFEASFYHPTFAEKMIASDLRNKLKLKFIFKHIFI